MLQRVYFPQSFCSYRCQEREGDSPVLGRAKYAKGEVLKRDHYRGTRRTTQHTQTWAVKAVRRGGWATRSDRQLKHRTASKHERRTGEGRPRRIQSPFQELTEHGKALRRPLLPNPVRPLRDFPLNYHSSSIPITILPPPSLILPFWLCFAIGQCNLVLAFGILSGLGNPWPSESECRPHTGDNSTYTTLWGVRSYHPRHLYI